MLGQVILRRFGILKCKAYFGTNRVSLFFFKILYCIFYSSYVLEIIEKLTPLARKSVSLWINCLEDILITHFFLSAMLMAQLILIHKFYYFRPGPHISFKYGRHNHLRYPMMGEVAIET